MDGFISPPRPAGVPRNHLGFMDGIANPNVADPEVANRLLWVVPGIGEPDWAVGGAITSAGSSGCSSSSGTGCR